MIPVSEPRLDGRDPEYVTECMTTGWISSAGRFLGEFEEEWARYCDRRFGVAVEGLAGLPGIRLQVERPWARSVWWMNGLVLDKQSGHIAASLAQALSALGVETRPFFLGMDRQPALRERGLFDGENYPVTDELAEMGLYLPSGVGLTGEQQEDVIGAVRKVLR